MKKLKIRVKNDEIVINTTDKSGKLCVSTIENYIQQGSKHIKGDREIEWGEVVRIQKRVTSHARCLIKVFNIGEQWGDNNQKRIYGAYSSEAGVVPVLSTMAKDHKPLERGEPKTRPVVAANTCVNGRLSDQVSDILVPVAMSEDSEECLSSEEMLYHVGEASKVIQEKGVNVIVTSEDVDGLYPNIDILASAKICGEAVRNSKIQFERIDYLWAGKYIACTCSQKEIDEIGLGQIAPKRKFL